MRKILLAISGGIDSMYLANRAPELFPGADFAVAHCNFQLRGDESIGDQDFVESWCKVHDMQCFSICFDTDTYAKEHHISTEMAARDLRYSWFKELCLKHDFDSLATAHNANDNAETLLLNLLRGTGTRGLRGMSKESYLHSCDPEEKPVKLLRPLLDLSRSQIEEWMLSQKLNWREDSTNSESLYKRNIIRNEVFPIFNRINPSFINTLNADIKRFAQVDDIAEDYYLSVLDNIKDQNGIIVDKLLNCKHWQYLLFRLLEPYSFSRETFDKLLALMSKYKECPKGTVTLSGKCFEAPNYILHARKGRLIISKR